MKAPTDPKRHWENKILKWEKARYSAWTRFSPFAWAVRARLMRATDMIFKRAEKNWKILELGCGSGILAGRLDGHFSNYLGLDIAENAIITASSQFSFNKMRFQPSTFEFRQQDVRDGYIPACDLAIFLGLTDWLSPDELKYLIERLNARHLLFSFTDSAKVGKANPYRWYREWVDAPQNKSCRGRSYSTGEIKRYVTDIGNSFEIISPSTWRNPGTLVWSSQ